MALIKSEQGLFLLFHWKVDEVSGDELAGRVLCADWLEALSRVLNALQQVLVVQMHDGFGFAFD